jgi:hypothetical protein
MGWITREPDCGLKCRKVVAEVVGLVEEEDILTVERVVVILTAEALLLAVI